MLTIDPTFPLAGAPESVPGIDAPILELSTVSGIVAATMLGVQIIKRFGGNVPIICAAPLWVISIVVALALTLFAHGVLNLLEGDLVEVLWRTGLAAASASGFYSWLRRGNTTAADCRRARPWQPRAP